MEISQGAYETHGITREFLDDKPKFKDIAKEFQEFINEKKLVIHNADFDLAFLNKELKEVGLPVISNVNVIDTLNVAREKFPGAQNSLDALCKRFKIDNSRSKNILRCLIVNYWQKFISSFLKKKSLHSNLY